MKIIGITGGTGSGKSVLSAELKRLGAEVIDADQIAREVSKKGGAAFEEIVQNFGTEILDEQGEINRKTLGGIVFANSPKLELLESITHKHILKKMCEEVRACGKDTVVLDVPLLFQCDFPIKCDLTVAVIADDDIRIKRIMDRDGISEAAARARMKNQLTNEEYKKLADVCFENEGDTETIKEFANKLCPGQ